MLIERYTLQFTQVFYSTGTTSFMRCVVLKTTS